jgi:hypothetical protein
LLTEAKSKAEAFTTTAKVYIPRMYAALRSENVHLSPVDARDRIQKDCIAIWSRRTILDALPGEAKNAEKQKSGRLGQTKRKCAAFSAAQKQRHQNNTMAVSQDGTIVEEAACFSNNASTIDLNLDPDHSVRQLRVPTVNRLSYSALLNENQQLRKQLICLQEERVLNNNTINDLKAALTKASFSPANQLPKTKLEHVIFDLQKFGTDLIAMMQTRKSTCVVQIDEVGNVISMTSNVEGSRT